MKAVILAAGRGKRMGRLTADIPKPLLPVRGKPLLDHGLEVLPDNVDEVIMVIGYQGDKIRQRYGSRYQRKKIQYIEQTELRGTAQAFLMTRPYLSEGERFVLMYGDELLTQAQMVECLAHEFSWLCREMTDASQSGIVTLSAEGRIQEVIEKPAVPASNIVAAGVMVVTADLFRYEPMPHANGEYYVTSMLNQFVKDHPVYAVLGTKDIAFTYAHDIERDC